MAIFKSSFKTHYRRGQQHNLLANFNLKAVLYLNHWPLSYYLANIFQGQIKYELIIYSLRGVKLRVNYSVHNR